MRSFKNVAKLIQEKRLAQNKYSEQKLSQLLGYKNGLFIENVEKSLCGIPLRMIGRISKILDITFEEIEEAFVKDWKETIRNHFFDKNLPSNKKEKEED